jgi:hypothetical protein
MGNFNLDMNKLTLIDTHVHYYPFCTFPEYFDAAYSNMQAAAKQINSFLPFTSILCLLETQTSHWYQELLGIATSTKQIGNWQLESLDSDQLLRLTKNNENELLLVPGKQIITSENLEVLIIGVTDEIPHKIPVKFYIEKYSDSHLVIIPWGVGKWLGKRGRIVSNLIQQHSNHKFALGDNSGRATAWKYVPQFNQARQTGINILAGSDPLPISGQYKKVASYGSVIIGSLQQHDIASQLREKLLDTRAGNINNYGHLDGVVRFIVSQILLRIRPIKSTFASE